jgi:c-di-GMP-binding flagellar brake protein YcgR
MVRRGGIVALGASESLLLLSGRAYDRRSNNRFPIVRDIQYRVLNGKNGREAGRGKTVNISSTGVLFSVQGPLAPGKRVELSISWPAQLDGKCGLKLVARGRVIRSEDMEVAVEIEKYEFRTRGTGALTTQAAGT